jgi:hypothetical protein
MEVDTEHAVKTPEEAAAAAATAFRQAVEARTAAAIRSEDVSRAGQLASGSSCSSGSGGTPINSSRPEKNFANESLITQCSNAKRAGRISTIFDSAAADTGPVITTGTVPVPRLGRIFDHERDDYSKTFHGARLTKGCTQTNEIITCSFDPKTLNCLACEKPHKILNTGVPFTLCLADQNFVPTICCRGGGRGETVVLGWFLGMVALPVPVRAPVLVPVPVSATHVCQLLDTKMRRWPILAQLQLRFSTITLFQRVVLS